MDTDSIKIHERDAKCHYATGKMTISEVVSLKALCTGVDISKADNTRLEDKARFQSEVRRMCGLQRTNKIITRAILHALHCKLRWRGQAWEEALCAGLLFQVTRLFSFSWGLVTF